MLSVQLWFCHWLIHLIRVRAREEAGGEREMENRIEEESRKGRVWSLCWIALEIGSINLGRNPHVPFTLPFCNTLAYKHAHNVHIQLHKLSKTTNRWPHFSGLKTVLLSHLNAHFCDVLMSVRVSEYCILLLYFISQDHTKVHNWILEKAFSVSFCFVRSVSKY